MTTRNSFGGVREAAIGVGWLAVAAGLIFAGCPQNQNSFLEEFNRTGLIPGQAPVTDNTSAVVDSGASKTVSLIGELAMQYAFETRASVASDIDTISIDAGPPPPQIVESSPDGGSNLAPGSRGEPDGNDDSGGGGGGGGGDDDGEESGGGDGSGGGGSSPEGDCAADATVRYSGRLAGTRFESIFHDDNSKSFTTDDSRNICVGFQSDAGSEQLLAAVTVPGYVFMPNLSANAIDGVGTVNTFSGTVHRWQTTFEYSVQMVVTDLRITPTFVSVDMAITVRGGAGAMTARGTGRHHFEATISGSSLNASSFTHYDVRLSASAANQPGVAIGTIQEHSYSGALQRQ